jgi:hypothetical protein
MSNYFRSGITSLLSKYVSDFGQDLNLSLWNGEMELEGIVLKAEELRRVIPINLTTGSLKELRVIVPWTRLVRNKRKTKEKQKKKRKEEKKRHLLENPLIRCRHRGADRW